MGSPQEGTNQELLPGIPHIVEDPQTPRFPRARLAEAGARGVADEEEVGVEASLTRLESTSSYREPPNKMIWSGMREKPTGTSRLNGGRRMMKNLTQKTSRAGSVPANPGPRGHQRE